MPQNQTEQQDNTKVYRPPIHEPIQMKPREYSFTNLGGKPSTDNRTSEQRNSDYWSPIKGAKQRFKSSMKNETNPLVGLERTVLPAMGGAALVTTPATMIGGTVGNVLVDNMTGGWGEWLEDKTGLPSELGNYTNPGAIYGGLKGYNIDKNKLASKFIKGDADLGWSPLRLDHWIFNKEARTPGNMAMATINRVLPFMSNIEKTPARIAAYKVGRRTKGNASVSVSDIKSNESTYTGSSTPEGNNGDRNLLGMYLFQNDPIVSKSPWFQKVASSFKPANGNGFSYGQRYSELYPGIENRRFRMESVVKDSRPLKFNNVDEFTNYTNGIGKLQGKEGDMVVDMGNGFQTFRQPGTNYVGPIDDVGGHMIKIDYNNKGKLVQTTQDMWKFNPADYNKRWSGGDPATAIRSTKQAALMDKVGTPFILQQENPIQIGIRRVWDSLQNIPSSARNRRQPLMQAGLLTLKTGGRFTFKESKLIKNSKQLNGKRDMRKKFIKSDRPTYSNNRVKKGQSGLRFASYDVVETPEMEFDTYKPDVFSPYNIPTIPLKNEETPVTEEKKDDLPPLGLPSTPKPATPSPTKSTSDTWTSPYTNKNKWATELTEAYKRAGITNTNALKMLVSQDALESGWGKSAQGKYNFGNLTTGKSWKGNYVQGRDKNAAGQAISQKFRSYNSMDEYAKDKVQFLQRLYDFDENDNISKFTSKLSGSNKGGRRYAEDRNYSNALANVYNKFQYGGVAQRDATYVTPKSNNPYNSDNNPSSEIVTNAPRWTRENGRLVKKPASKQARVIPLETVSPEFELLMGVPGVTRIGSGIAKRVTDVPRMKSALQEYISPFGYQLFNSYDGKVNELGRFFKGYVLKGKDSPANPWYVKRMAIEPERTVARQEAMRLYMGNPKPTDNLYIKNIDGTYRYNPDRIPKANIDYQRSAFKQAGNGNPSSEYLTTTLNGPKGTRTGNAGGLTSIIDNKGNFVIDDVWDLNPLQKFNWLPKPIRNIEAGKFIGGKPFRVYDNQIGKLQ